MPISASSRILVVGGSGLIGTSLIERLVECGYPVTVPTRNRERTKKLLPLPRVELVEADVHDPATLDQLLPEHGAVVNLVGILQGSPAAFRRAHAELPAKLVKACAQAGVRRLLHVSALGADPSGPSHYLRSKGEGERTVRDSTLDWTVFRPSLVVAGEGGFVPLLTGLVRRLPLVPLAGAHSRVQPVWIEDVSRALLAALHRDELIGRSLNLVGPRVYTMAELTRYIGELSGHPRPVLALPDPAARLLAALFSFLSNPPLSADNLDSLTVDNVDPAGFPAVLGWAPTCLEAVAPAYVANLTPRGRYLSLRRSAHR
ncbi:complex I NDUFA9 subunit family protein [Chitinimonas lacunae]|uniref:Complex I NDUFA9 subunit family protein n=1 Tax=Chitinimonas lacunae TaxID=1963018 RepID=A0ABV8MUV3_9NEIS